MAFVNEKLTQEERAEFAKKGIKKPDSHVIANPLYRTIDRENNMCLWHLGNFGREDYNDHSFLFEHNGESNIIAMQYSDTDPNEDSIVWSVSQFEKVFSGSEEFAEDFKSALTVYAVNGRHDQHGISDVNVCFGGKKL